ncbi:MAG: hypothetical protein V4710_14195, partial [Verrucomicrobiota bacterium]
MPVHRPRSLRRPLCVSLSRFGSSLAVCAAITLAGGSSAMAQERWQGNAPQGVPGDGFLWTNPANWLGDLLPSASADLEFGSGTPTTIILNGPQSANSISFTDGGFTLGAFGTQTLLTNLSGSLLVNPGQLATINASYAGTFGMYIDGGGTIFLNNPQPLFTGDITVDNGSTLMANLGGITPQVNGTASVQNVGRQDALPLGLTPGVRTVTLQNNGEFKLIGSGANPDGATKNLVLGSGGGVINTAAGYIQFNLDDGSQISGTGDLVKKGAGRLTLTSQDYLLSGNLVINAGIVDFGRLNAGGGGGTRFSSFSAESTFTINGGIVVPNSGTQGRIDNKITLNDTGAIGVQGTDHIYGNDAAGPVVGWTLNGGTILLRDAFNVQQARLPRIRTLMSGSGIVDVVGATGNAANSRLVLERGDLAHDFSGTFVVKDLANVESNPRNGIDGTARSGKAFGNATIDLRGFGALLDVRDAANNTSNILLNSGASDYSTNHIVVSGVEPGGRQTVSISNGGATGAGTGNVMPFASLTIGSQRLVLTAANSYGIRFNNVILKGSPTLEVNNNTILGGNQTVLSETATGKALTKQRNGELFLIDALGLSTLNIEQGAVRLIGENGRIVPGTLSNTGVVNINGASNSVTGGLLHLDNNGSVAGTLAAANGDRLDNNVSVRMFSNALLRLTGPATGAVTEIAGSTISVLGGHAGFDVVKTGTSADLVVLQLGASGLSISGNGTVNLTGTNLGATGGNSSRIIMPGQAESAILPTNFHSGNEWARYNTSVDTNVLLGVQPFTSYTVNSAETGWQSGQQIKLNGATGVTLTAARTIDTLNLQFSAANQSVNTNGNTLLIEDGGILVATNTAGIIGASGGLGGITAGTTAAATPLHIINNAQLDLKVAPKDNGAGGAVTMVKSGTGTLRLTHDLLGVGTAAAGIGKLNAATWSAANTGGWVIQDGTLDVHRGQFLGPAGTTITLAGGTLQLNEPMPVGSDFQQVPGWGQNIVVTGNSNLVNDNNGESNDANASNNTFYKLGSLTIDGSHVLGLGGFQSL